MSREVPFDKDEKCDLCGKPGAFDFMGDYICPECLKKQMSESVPLSEVDASETPH